MAGLVDETMLPQGSSEQEPAITTKQFSDWPRRILLWRPRGCRGKGGARRGLRQDAMQEREGKKRRFRELLEKRQGRTRLYT